MVFDKTCDLATCFLNWLVYCAENLWELLSVQFGQKVFPQDPRNFWLENFDYAAGSVKVEGFWAFNIIRKAFKVDLTSVQNWQQVFGNITVWLGR
jgi:hypothetical protein